MAIQFNILNLCTDGVENIVAGSLSSLVNQRFRTDESVSSTYHYLITGTISTHKSADMNLRSYLLFNYFSILETFSTESLV